MDFSQPELLLPFSFYNRPVLHVAKDLLGKILLRKQNGKILSGKIVETEAYHETNDPSCHAHRGKTRRNAVMFGPPGHLYVYFTYGMHYCMNVVAEAEGIAAAVLIRALEPLSGIELMKSRRDEKFKEKDLCNGPAKLCQAFAITTKENGISLLENKIWIADSELVSSKQIAVSPRIGISSGQELPWRFYLKDNHFVSGKKNGK